LKAFIATAACVLLVNFSALAQGTILLQNLGNGLSSPVRGPDGALIPAGSSQYTIELLAGTTAASVAPLLTPITTSTWVGNGWFGVGDGERVLPGFAPGSFPWFQLRAWINTGGVNSYPAALQANQAGIPSPKTSAFGSCDSSPSNFSDFSSQNLLARNQYLFYSS